MLDDFLDDDVVPDVGQGVANLLVDRSAQNLLDNLVAAGALGKYGGWIRLQYPSSSRWILSSWESGRPAGGNSG
jgi:hypothetical protein